MSALESYRRKIEAQFKELSAEVDRLAALADKQKSEVRLRLLREVEDLRKRQDALRRRLHDLNTARGSAWQDLKSGVEQAWSDLRRGVESARSRFGGPSKEEDKKQGT